MLTDSDLKKYSLSRAILQAAKNEGQLTGCFEAEISQQLTGRMAELAVFDPKDPSAQRIMPNGGFYIPRQVLFQRAISAVTGTGTNLVSSTVGPTIALLRAKSILARFGAQFFDNLVGNLTLPRQTLGATLDWVGEQQPCNTHDYGFGALSLSPHRCSGAVKYSQQLLRQTGNGIETFLRNDLLQAFGAILDKAGLAGTGTANEPRGILHTTGIGSVTFGAAATGTKLADLEFSVGDNNGDVAPLGLVTTPSVRKKWRTLPRFGTTYPPLWDDQNRVIGYDAAATKNVPNDRVIFGNFADLFVGIWGDACEIIVNPYSFARDGTVQMVINYYADTGVFNVASFAASSDSGAQ